MVPVAMKGVRVQGEVAHLGLGDDDAGLIASLIELGLDAQPGGRARVPDEFDEGLEGAEGTRARWEMRDVDAEAQVVGQPLQRGFPAARPIPVAAAGVGGDGERVCRGYACRPNIVHHWRIEATAKAGVS
jgi:hypothetical protein